MPTFSFKVNENDPNFPALIAWLTQCREQEVSVSAALYHVVLGYVLSGGEAVALAPTHVDASIGSDVMKQLVDVLKKLDKKLSVESSNGNGHHEVTIENDTPTTAALDMPKAKRPPRREVEPEPEEIVDDETALESASGNFLSMFG